MRHFLFVTAVLAVAAACSLGWSAPQAKQASPPAHRTQKLSAPALPSVTLPSEPGLYAVIYTSMGTIICRLFEKEAPKTVANFRGLAAGTKAWTDPISGRVKHGPLYSGTTLHRVIPEFMIQGGDPAGDGSGSPGYKFDDEIDPSLTFDHPGVLAMANSGPNTNGCQFFITVAPAGHLNGNYSIFGQVVSGQEIADAISRVPRNAEDKPLAPVKIVTIAIRRVTSTAATSSPK